MAMIVVQSLTNSFGEMFIAANLCLGELEERLIVGDTVYGN